MALTQKTIDRANQRRRYSDGRGLFLSVSASGRKTWAFIYRFPAPSRDKVGPDGKVKRGYTEREMNLGPVKWRGIAGTIEDLEALTLEDARHRAMELQRLVRQGRDPMTERDRDTRTVIRQKRDGSTFKDVAERFIKMKKAEWDEGGRSEQSWKSSLANHVYPSIGAKLVADVDRLDVRDLLLPIWTTVTTTATRLLPRIEEVFEFAIAEGLMSGENPADRAKVRKLLPAASRVYTPKQHKALSYSDLPAFMPTLRAREGIAPKALEFLILTASRTSDVTGATWDEFDLDAGLWSIPASRMKVKKHHSGAERAPHRVPLPPVAVALLRALPREADNPYAFISRMKPGHGLSNMAMLDLLKNDLGYAGSATVHGFRSSFRTWVSEATSYPDDLAEKALAHEEEDKTVAAYKRTDLYEKRRPMMADWAAFLDGGDDDAA